MKPNDGMSAQTSETTALDSVEKNRPETFAVDSGNQLEAIPGANSLAEIGSSPRGLELKTLNRFDTIIVRTANSQYRIFLLDPETGRVLLEGGQLITEPMEVMIIGASFGGSVVRPGWISVGLRIEACAGGKYIRTSIVQSLHLEHQSYSQSVKYHSLSQ